MYKVNIILVALLGIFLLISCGGDSGDEESSRRTKKAELDNPETKASESKEYYKSDDAAVSGSKEKDIRERNLEIQARQAANRTPCDTLSLQEYLIDNYPAGTYLVEFDETLKYPFRRPAVIYLKQEETLVLAVIAKSKEGERFVEVKNLVGYESSFSNLDSTRLGTAFFYLTMFECDGSGNFSMVWEERIPIHNGFNSMKIKRWGKDNTPYCELNFEAGIISGFRNYNYFFVDGFKQNPHLLETYTGLSKKRIMADVNKDKYPDYYEFRFIVDDTSLYIRQLDSVPFYWDEKKNLYVTRYSSRLYRKY